MPIVGRTSLVVGSYKKKYAKKTKGMGTIFIESINEKVLIANIIILRLACLITADRFILLISSFITLIFAFLISKWIEKRIGGMTGDTCGFITEIAQIIFMFTVLFIEGMLL